MFNHIFFRLMLGVCVSFGAHAQDWGEWNFSGSGFFTVGAGVMLGGTRNTVLDKQCPCFTADYAQNGIYDGRGGLQFGPDSKLGLQGTATLPDERYSLTTQVVARATQGHHVDLEWLYGTYRFSDDTAMQLGRKRLPLFYYSDSQDVGFSLPWTHLPPQLYGWEVVNYNGISLQHRAQINDWDVTGNLLAGGEQVNDSGYWKVYNGQATQTKVSWKNIVGGNVQFGKNGFEARLGYTQSATQRSSNGVWNNASRSVVASTDPFLNNLPTRQRIYTAAFNFDYRDWGVLSEFIYIDRPGANFKDHGSRLGVTHRFDRWEATAHVSEYHSQAVIAMGGDPLGQESHINRSLTARYFLTPRSDIKLQLDAQHDRGGINWTPKYGDARLLSLAYDRIF